MKPILLLNEPLHDKQPIDMKYETMIVNSDVPVAIKTNHANTKLKETRQVKPSTFAK